MKRISFSYIILSLLFLTALFPEAMASDIPGERNGIYNHLDSNTGLSNSSINTIFQDSEGIIWLGTWDGLNSFDGTVINQYRPSFQNSSSLSNQVIRNIAEDHEKRLWVVTDYGINCMDKTNGTFEHHFLGYDSPYIYEEELFSATISKDGDILAALKGKGIFLYDRAENRFEPVETEGASDVRKLLFSDRYDNLWAESLDHHLLCITIDPENRTGDIHRHPTDIRKARTDNDHRIWFIDKGILGFYDIYDNLKVISTGQKVGGELKCVSSSKGKILLSTSVGLYQLGRNDIRFLKKDNSILSICCGSQDIIWIGTDGNGVFYNSHQPVFISTIPYPRRHPAPIRAILADHHGNLWFGTKGEGLWRKSGEDFINYDVGSGRTKNSVLSLEQGNGCIWIGTDGKGLKYFDYDKKRVCDVDLSGYEVGRLVGSIYAIKQITSNTIYLGTSGQGLFELHLTHDKKVIDIVQYKHSSEKKDGLTSNIIYDIIEDGRFLWLGTRGGGLLQFDRQNVGTVIFNKESTGPAAICSNDIITLHKDSDGKIWVGTTAGLTVLERKDGQEWMARHISEKDGIPNTNIHSILEDNKRQIWLSTSNGITMVSMDSYQMKSWNHRDGLDNNEFSDGGGFSDPITGHLYFGSISGLNVIVPNLVTEPEYRTRPLLYHTLIDNTPYLIRDRTIDTGFKTGSITMSFSVPDYINGDKCELSYAFCKSKSPDHLQASDWIRNGQNRSIILNNLSTGNYYLHVRACSVADLWSQPETYRIKVRPPKSLSPMMLTLYLLTIAGISLWMRRLYLSRREINEELEKEKQKRKVKEEIHKSKMAFFKNLAREFSNSITMIFGSIDNVSGSEMDSNVRKQMTTIRSNTERLHTQIQRLLEFGQMEQKKMDIRYEKIDIPELVKYSMDNFIDMIDAKDLIIKMDISDGLPSYILDRNMMERIVFNILSNSMNLTPKSGKIRIGICRTADGSLDLSISNSGKGIAPEELENLFNRYSVLESFESKLSQGQFSYGSIGLPVCKEFVMQMGGRIDAESVPDDHTTIRIVLPLHQESEISPTVPTDPTSAFSLPELSAGDMETNSGRKTGKILVIDSQSEIRGMICKILSADYDTVDARNPEEVLKIVNKEEFDLIICNDNRCSDKIRLIENLRQKISEHIPIIVLSDDADIEKKVKILETGADLFINKPFHPRYLKAVVDKMMKHRSHLYAQHGLPSTTEIKDSTTVEAVTPEKIGIWQIADEKKEFIHKLNQIMDENYSDENYNQDTLAYDMAISRVQLYRKTKQLLDTTPGNYIRLFRLQKAEEMLRSTTMTVQEIMYDCGFHNKAYFYREFAKLHNCSPKDFRNSISGLKKNL